MPHISRNILEATVHQVCCKGFGFRQYVSPRLNAQVCAAKLFTVANFRSNYYRFFCQVDMTEPSFIYRPLADPRTFDLRRRNSG